MAVATRVVLCAFALVLLATGCASGPPTGGDGTTPVDAELLAAHNALRGLGEQLSRAAQLAEGGVMPDRDLAELGELLDWAGESLPALAAALADVPCPGDRAGCLEPLAELQAVIPQTVAVVAEAQPSADLAAEVAADQDAGPRLAGELAAAAAAVTVATGEFSAALGAYRSGYDQAAWDHSNPMPTEAELFAGAAGLSLVAVVLAMWTRRWAKRHPDALIRKAREAVHSSAALTAVVIGGATLLVALMTLLDTALGDLRPQVLGQFGMVLLMVPVVPIILLFAVVRYLWWRRAYRLALAGRVDPNQLPTRR